MKILLVEDEIEMQKKYHSLLRAWKEYSWRWMILIVLMKNTSIWIWLCFIRYYSAYLDLIKLKIAAKKKHYYFCQKIHLTIK
jgi:hypothetical protein